MSKVFITPDVHGKYELMAGLLFVAGVIEPIAGGHFKRAPGILSLQIGDLINGTEHDRDGDLLCLSVASEWFDTVCMGNHEHPFFGGPPFSGFFRDPDVAIQCHQLLFKSILVPCILYKNILISHAGLVENSLTKDMSAIDAYDFVWKAWKHSFVDPVFSNVGRSRGGRHPQGGILWSDWSEEKAVSFNQIVGHTPQESPQWKHFSTHTHWALNIDCDAKRGKRITGLMIEDDEFKFITFEGIE